MKPLKIGILGASRIAEQAIIGPALATGARLVAIASRDGARAATFAKDYGVEKSYNSYHDLIADPDVELVYNSLINGLHAPLNLAAIQAGKAVLSEKPFASNANEAAAIRSASDAANVFVMEAFHYLFHPVSRRMRELLTSGEIGDLVHAEAVVAINPPPDTDARWNLELAGGAMMDIGCYALHAHRTLAPALTGTPRVVDAEASVRHGTPGVDQWMKVNLRFPSGATAATHCDFTADEWRFSYRIVGTRGEAEVANFVLPQSDDRITIRTANSNTVEHLGTTPSFTYQLQAVIAHLNGDAVHPLPLTDAVETMRLIDDSYSAAGLPVRPSQLVFE